MRGVRDEGQFLVRPDHDEQIVADGPRSPVQPERLAEQPLEAVPPHRVSTAASDREAEPKSFESVRQRVDQEGTGFASRASGVNRGKGGSTLEPILDAEGEA